ncbi:DUF922 domain-containing protein [Adhaeribacter aquaticus]|uniref:DUF922 domain-containing protein n=1 Tax=Adhaeribacter aquaticus TaxID=299567 RepID=UPI00040F182A|nr:DUF922 domain-containing protein [Adhaeribacter aquaticus]
MNTIVTKTAITFFLFLASFCSYGQDTNFIIWSKNVLKPSDFTVLSEKVNAGQKAALTTGQIGYRYSYKNEGSQNIVFIEIQNRFSKDKSWMKSDAINNQNLLEHEQLHFDLGEVYARMFTKILSEKRIAKNLRENLPQIYKEVFSQMEAKQVLYDQETNHGLIKEKQKEWKVFIEEELEKYKDFADKKVSYSVS